jgi:HAD superfamily hydrolase (TIGR01509 family)
MPLSILFDFNGVIVDDEPVHCQAMITTLAEQAISLSDDEYRANYLGLDDSACFRKAFHSVPGREPTEHQIADLVARKHEHYAKALEKGVPLVPGVVEFVHLARETGISLALVSGALRREIEPVLERLGLATAFPCLVAAEDVDRCKPDPAGYIQALTRLASRPEEAMILEDSLPGLAAAQAAHVRCTMLTTSHPRRLLAGAHAVWENFLGRTPRDLPWLND